MPLPITQNTLFYGDNLDILREYVPTESVDLIYLDPPFNSNRNYNVLFKDESGKEAEAQIAAFEDTWHWNEQAERVYKDLISDAPHFVSEMISALRQCVGRNQMMAYLVMMTARLVELHRVLKPTGSLYLHCDPTASHYLKIILDTVFGPTNYRNEIIWRRTSSHNSGRIYGPIHDVILFYAKTQNYNWNVQYVPLDSSYVESHYKHVENGRRYKRQDITGAGIRNGETGKPWRGINPTAKGRHWMRPPVDLDELDNQGLIYWSDKEGAWPYLKLFLDERLGSAIQDVWDDINPINSQAIERLGYPTQKPLALLERILQASSNPGDVCLDPFCGCGTAVTAAEKLGRRWIGIDITHLAISLIKYRLRDAFPSVEFQVIGEPKDAAAAQQLARENRYQFQWWALSLVRARPFGGDAGSKTGKKGSDQGVDGVINFLDDASGKLKTMVVQVKSGHVSSRDVRDLVGTIDRIKAPMGVLLTMDSPSTPMITEAASAGFYTTPFTNEDFPRIQIARVEDLMCGLARIQMPDQYGTFKQTQRIKKEEGRQGTLI